MSDVSDQESSSINIVGALDFLYHSPLFFLWGCFSISQLSTRFYFSQSSLFDAFFPPRSLFRVFFFCVWYRDVWFLFVSCSRMIVNGGWWEWNQKRICLTFGRRYQWIKEKCHYVLCEKPLFNEMEKEKKELEERAWETMRS